MQITVNKDKSEVTIVAAFSEIGVPSKKRNANKVVIPGDGKSYLHFSDNGKALVDGKEMKIGLNGYSVNHDYIKPTTAEEAVTA